MSLERKPKVMFTKSGLIENKSFKTQNYSYPSIWPELKLRLGMKRALVQLHDGNRVRGGPPQ